MNIFYKIAIITVFCFSGLINAMQAPAGPQLRARLAQSTIDTDRADAIKKQYKQLVAAKKLTPQLKEDLDADYRVEIRQFYASLGNIIRLITEFQDQLKNTECDRAAFHATLRTFVDTVRALYKRTGDRRMVENALASETELLNMAKTSRSSLEEIVKDFDGLRHMLEKTPQLKKGKSSTPLIQIPDIA